MILPDEPSELRENDLVDMHLRSMKGTITHEEVSLLIETVVAQKATIRGLAERVDELEAQAFYDETS